MSSLVQQAEAERRAMIERSRAITRQRVEQARQRQASEKAKRTEALRQGERAEAARASKISTALRNALPLDQRIIVDLEERKGKNVSITSRGIEIVDKAGNREIITKRKQIVKIPAGTTLRKTAEGYSAVKGDRKIVITRSGDILDVPKSAKINPSLVKNLRQEVRTRLVDPGQSRKVTTIVQKGNGVQFVVKGRTSKSFSGRDIENLSKQRSKYLSDIKEERIKQLIRQGSTLEAREKPKSLLESAQRKTREIQQNIELSKFKEPTAVEKRVFQQVAVLGALGVARGVLGVGETIKDPRQAAKNIISAARTPVKTIKAMGEEFTIDPVGVVAEYYSYGKALNMAGKAVKRSPVGRWVREELFIAKQPKQIRPYVREIVKAAKVQKKINPYKVKGVKPNFMEVKSLTRTDALALRKALQKTDSVVFGSQASRTLSRGRTPIPKDVDLATRNVAKFNAEFIKNVPRKLRSNYIVQGQKIYRKVLSKSKLTDPRGAIKRGNVYYDPIFDVKPLKRLIPERSILTKKGYIPVSGYVTKIVKGKKSILPRLKKKAISTAFEVPTQKLVKIDKIKFVGFGEQTTRKALGTLQTLIEKNVRRAKDPQSFIIGLEIQLKALKLKKPITRIGKALNKRKITKLDNALKVLKSKKFADLLDKKVPGLTKEYPILNKLPTKRLKRVNLKRVRSEVTKKVKKLRPAPERKVKKVTKAKIVKRVKKPSRLPKKLKKTVSRLPKKRPSRIPSKIPRSRLPSKIPSKIPSRLPSRVPSKIPSRVPSKIPGRFKPKPKTIPIKRPDTQKEKEKIVEQELNRRFVFFPDLAAKIRGERATKAQRKALLKVGRIFTGQEARKIIK